MTIVLPFYTYSDYTCCNYLGDYCKRMIYYREMWINNYSEKTYPLSKEDEINKAMLLGQYQAYEDMLYIIDKN